MAAEMDLREVVADYSAIMGFPDVKKLPENLFGRFFERMVQMQVERGMSPVAGTYRNHEVSVTNVVRSSGEDSSTETRYSVKFANQNQILLQLRNRSILSNLRDYYTEHIEVGESEFDGKFSIKGNNENKIKSALGPSVRHKIKTLKNFNLTVDAKKPEEAYCLDYNRSISASKMNPDRFRLIIDTIVDIVEKMESKLTINTELPAFQSQTQFHAIKVDQSDSVNWSETPAPIDLSKEARALVTGKLGIRPVSEETIRKIKKKVEIKRPNFLQFFLQFQISNRIIIPDAQTKNKE